MQDSQERLRRLAHVATRYYLEDWKQSDIAKELGVSRPLVSRMLSEARELGVVEITVHAPGQQRQDLTDDRDFAIQIPRDVLSRCPRVIGLCSANTSSAALEGALNTGLFTALVVREGLAEELLHSRD